MLLIVVRVFSISSKLAGTSGLVSGIKEAISDNKELPLDGNQVSVEFPNGRNRNESNKILTVARVYQKDETSQETVDLIVSVVADEVKKFAKSSVNWCKEVQVFCEVPKKSFANRLI